MSSAAQSDLTLLESAVVAAETQQAQPTPLLEAQADAQIDSQTQHNMPGQAQVEQLKLESCSPPVAETSLEDLLAQNSPGSLHRSSWVQIHKDLQTLNNHKARLQVGVMHLLTLLFMDASCVFTPLLVEIVTSCLLGLCAA